MHEILWDDVVREFRERRAETLRRSIDADSRWGFDTASIDSLLAGPATPTGQELRDRLTQAFLTAADPEGMLVLSMYLLLVAREKWQLSTAWDLIETFLREAQRAGHQSMAAAPDATPSERAALDLILAYADVIITCTSVENALNNNAPTQFADRARDVTLAAGDVGRRVESLAPRFDGPRLILRAMASTDSLFYHALTMVADAVDAVLRGRREAPDLVRSAVKTIASTELALGADVYRLELRAHRLTLDQFAKSLTKRWLFVDRCKVVYCYPFSTTVRVNRACLMCRARELGARDLLVSDMWGAGDDGAGFTGVALDMPGLRIQQPDAGGLSPVLSANAEVRITGLGNHYLRLEFELAEAHVHEIAQVLRRPMEVMGHEAVRTDGGLKFTQIGKFANDVVASLRPVLEGADPGASLNALLYGSLPPRRLPDRSDDASSHRCTACLPAGYVRRRGAIPEILAPPQRLPASKDAHVVLSIREMTTRTWDGRDRRPATGEDLRDADIVGGFVLRHPVGQSAAALDEWTRYQDDPDQAREIRMSFRGDVVLATANTTILAMPGTPDFLATSHEEAAEFVATLPALLRDRGIEVATFVAAAQSGLGRTRDVRRLDAVGQQLKDQVALSRQVVAAIHSPAVTKTVVGRRQLDYLYDASEIARREIDLQAQLDHATATYEQYVARATQSQRRTLSLVLTFVGATAITSWFTLLEKVVENIPNWIELSVVIALAVSLLWIRYRGD